MVENQNIMIEEEESSFDLMQLWRLFTRNWPWFIVSMVVCVLVAFIYLWFTPTTVTVTGKMEIIDRSKKGSSGMSAGLAMLNSLPMGLGSSLGGAAGAGAIDSEKEIMMSNTSVRNVVKELGLYTEYRLCEWGKKTLLYQDNPLEVSLDEAHLAWLDSELPLYFHQIKLTINKDNSGYTIEPTLVEGEQEIDLPSQTFTALPATLKTESGTLTIKVNNLPERQAKAYEGSYTLKVTITPPSIVANDFIGRTSLNPPSKKVLNILIVSVTDDNLLRGIDFVNHLVDAYNKRANDEKNEEARKIDEFVRERLALVDAELGSSDAAWENSKKNFQITTPEVDAEEALTKKSEYEAQLVAIGTELQLHDFLSDYINNPANLFEIIPSGMAGSSVYSSKGSDGGSSSASSSSANGNASLIAQHNSLVNQRKDLLKSVSEMSPQVQRLTESIQELHPTLQLAMKRDRQQLVMQKDAINREYAKYTGRIGSAPQMERVLTEIGRQREIKQGVYLVMLQKREETAMQLANTTDKGRLIDEVQAVGGSAKPQKKMVLLVALFLGAILPMAILYLLLMFKQKIDTRDELEAATKLPILAEITSTGSNEAIRNLRTNLLLNLKEGQKTILVASQNIGDGKSFIAQHLAESFNAIGKKAILINGDLRKGAAPERVDGPALIKGQHPSDVLASEAFAQQVVDAKSSNDYVILDSPALSQYADALQLAQFADATLFIAKAGKTKKSDLESITSNTNLPNPLIVFNV